MSYQLKSIPFPKPLLGLSITQDDIEEELFSVTCADKSVRVFAVSSGREVMSKKAHNHSLNCLAMSNEAPGRSPIMVTSSRDNKVVLWNPARAQIIRGLKLQIPEIRAMAIYLGPTSDRGRVGVTYLVLGSINGLISVWDMSSSRCHCVLKDHKQCIQALGVGLVSTSLPDGTEVEKIVIVSGSSDKSARTWDLLRGTAKVVFQTRHIVGAVAIAGRGFRSLVATAGADRNIRIWDESTGILLHLMQGHLDAVFS
jgi:WD40 repeat protein